MTDCIIHADQKTGAATAPPPTVTAVRPTHQGCYDRPMTDYTIHTDVKYAPLEQIDLGALGASVPEPWWNQSLCRVNDCVVRLGVFLGEFHWHKHDTEDEYFQVLEGELELDIRDEPGAEALAEGGEAGRTLALTPGQAVLVPRGVVHRTRAKVRSVVLMIEGAGIVPTGDA